MKFLGIKIDDVFLKRYNSMYNRMDIKRNET